MSVIEIYRERLPFHPLLGRNVHFDSRSKAYALQPKAVPVKAVRHAQHIGILDQGQVGACSGNGATSCAYHEPFFTDGAPNWRYAPDETGALGWYHENTVEDSYSGTYPPDDTGSDTLTASKVGKEAGVSTGYQAALDLDSSLQQLMTVPGITGIPWYNSMFDVGSNGLITVTASSGLAGGHLIVVDEIVEADGPGNGTGTVLVGGDNSWNTSWGAQGRWYLKASDWWALRQNQGDVFFWMPKDQPAPTPTPDPTVPSYADEALWADTVDFRADHHVVPHIVQAAKALKLWGAQVGLDV